MRKVALVVLLLAAVGCFAPPRGTDFGIETARVTELALDVNEAYAAEMHRANQDYYTLRFRENLTAYQRTMLEESTPGEVQTLDPETGEVVTATAPKLSAARAQELLAMFAVKAEQTAAARDADERMFEATMEAIGQAKEVQAAWVRYLIETSSWNEAQRGLMRRLLEDFTSGTPR